MLVSANSGAAVLPAAALPAHWPQNKITKVGVQPSCSRDCGDLSTAALSSESSLPLPLPLPEGAERGEAWCGKDVRLVLP